MIFYDIIQHTFVQETFSSVTPFISGNLSRFKCPYFLSLLTIPSSSRFTTSSIFYILSPSLSLLPFSGIFYFTTSRSFPSICVCLADYFPLIGVILIAFKILTSVTTSSSNSTFHPFCSHAFIIFLLFWFISYTSSTNIFVIFFDSSLSHGIMTTSST